VFVPTTIDEILTASHISTGPIEGSADQLLIEVLGDLEHLADCYQELISVANSEGLDHISNYAQDRITAINKHIWMLRSTLE